MILDVNSFFIIQYDEVTTDEHDSKNESDGCKVVMRCSLVNL